MKSAEKKLPTMEPRISQSVKPKRSTTKTEDPARMKPLTNFCGRLSMRPKHLQTRNPQIRIEEAGDLQCTAMAGARTRAGRGLPLVRSEVRGGAGLSGYARNLDDERVRLRGRYGSETRRLPACCTADRAGPTCAALKSRMRRARIGVRFVSSLMEDLKQLIPRCRTSPNPAFSYMTSQRR